MGSSDGWVLVKCFVIKHMERIDLVTRHGEAQLHKMTNAARSCPSSLP